MSSLPLCNTFISSRTKTCLPQSKSSLIEVGMGLPLPPKEMRCCCCSPLNGKEKWWCHCFSTRLMSTRRGRFASSLKTSPSVCMYVWTEVTESALEAPREQRASLTLVTWCMCNHKTSRRGQGIQTVSCGFTVIDTCSLSKPCLEWRLSATASCTTGKGWWF